MEGDKIRNPERRNSQDNRQTKQYSQRWMKHRDKEKKEQFLQER